MRDWISGGLPAPLKDDAAVVKLDVYPKIRTMGIGQQQRFKVMASFSDGTRRDVSAESLFKASDETVATVTTDGDAKITGNGEGAVLVRFEGLVGTARLISPFATPRVTAKAPKLKVDQLVQNRLDALGLDA